MASGLGARINFTSCDTLSRFEGGLEKSSDYPFSALLLAIAVVSNCDVGLVLAPEGEDASPSTLASQIQGKSLENVFAHSFELERFDDTEVTAKFNDESTGIAIDLSARNRDRNNNLNLGGVLIPDGDAYSQGITEDHVITNLNGAPISSVQDLIAVVTSITAFGGGVNRFFDSLLFPPSLNPANMKSHDEGFRQGFILQVLAASTSTQGAFDNCEISVSSLFGVVLGDFNGDSERPNPGIIVISVEADCSAYVAGIRIGFQLISAKGDISSALHNEYLQAASHPDNRDKTFSKDASWVNDKTLPAGMSYIFLNTTPMLTVKFNIPTKEYSMVAKHFNKCCSLSNALRENGGPWEHTLCSLIQKLPVYVRVLNIFLICANFWLFMLKVLREIAISRLLRLGQECLGAATHENPHIPWNYTCNADDLNRLLTTWTRFCEAKGRRRVIAMKGSADEYTTAACLLHKIEPVDAQAGIASATYSIKVKISLLAHGAFSGNTSNPIADSIRKKEITKSPVVRALATDEEDEEVDDCQGVRFVAALFRTPGSPNPVITPPGAPNLETTVTIDPEATTATTATPATPPGTAATAATVATAPDPSTAQNFFISVAQFKEKTKNRPVTKHSAASDAMLRGLLLLVSRGLIKAVWAHQPGGKPSKK